MKPIIIRTIAELRQEISAYRRRSSYDQKVGFVPTMGYLHDGHASLLRKSVSDNGLTVLSIFVNPIQFGPGEDLDKYPRDEERDIRVATEAGTDIVFLPSVQEMYPQSRVTTVTVAEVTDSLCGASRPGHFDGVATVVAKLFNIVQPDRAYFGMKDAQQVAVVTRMVQDLNLPVEIVPCPILREKDGLALSSRNVYLGAEERTQALQLSKSLSQVEEWIMEGMTATQIIARLKAEIEFFPLADIDYVDILTYPELTPPNGELPLKEIDVSLLVAVAVRYGKTRLIDNKLLNPSEVGADLCFAK
ncbi:pantoate--beta-alanine ligase [Cohnella luojiensis]|uniref:Pantothenate synthetase n=1 Tax=Cohnella luojiensis TaxID=652876 RepID=A0A4Y8M4H6_9BACL|nr:pantoate--beta-alanine ligase [Cohnella luojiensis]TFE30035.1 pantoate--beta-alanine ligase [Cohnella luojiensis]